MEQYLEALQELVSTLNTKVNALQGNVDMIQNTLNQMTGEEELTTEAKRLTQSND